jgi:trehalose-6-phosphatase
VAYLGDDLTDEDAFRALKGKGLSVLVRKESRTTEADCWLKPPDELLDFLKKWHKLS